MKNTQIPDSDKKNKEVKEIDFFVNLRSALLNEKGSYLYVGGGITADSIPEKEWEETCIKSETLFSVFYK